MNTILITGASRGIGAAIARYYANKKYNIIITYNTNKTDSDNLVKELSNITNIENYYLNLKDEDSINNLYSKVKEKYNTIDILVNNASLSLDNELEYKTKDEFMEVLEVNVVGTFLMCKYFDKIIENGYIFNISSTDGIDTGSNLSIDYNASKAAINSMTTTLSTILTNKIISICPNWVNTEAIQEMNQDYLKEEMKRINQDKLINPNSIPILINKLINENTKNGSIIRMDSDINE